MERVYEMNNVVVSIMSRKNGGVDDDLCDVLTDEEKRQLEGALKLDLPDFPNLDLSLSHKKEEKKE
ncbi:unnamed protein product [Brassica oleracea var. botrytis]